MKISEMTTNELKERLILEVINYQESADRLFNFPFIRKGSFAILPQLCIQKLTLLHMLVLLLG